MTCLVDNTRTVWAGVRGDQRTIVVQTCRKPTTVHYRSLTPLVRDRYIDLEPRD